MLRLLIDAAELMSEAIPHDQELESDDPFMQDRETERERIADQKLDDAESEAAAERDTPHEFVRPGMTNMVDDFAKRTAHAATGPTLTMIEKRQNLIDILEASNEADRKQ